MPPGDPDGDASAPVADSDDDVGQHQASDLKTPTTLSSLGVGPGPSAAWSHRPCYGWGCRSEPVWHNPLGADPDEDDGDEDPHAGRGLGSAPPSSGSAPRFLNSTFPDCDEDDAGDADDDEISPHFLGHHFLGFLEIDSPIYYSIYIFQRIPQIIATTVDSSVANIHYNICRKEIHSWKLPPRKHKTPPPPIWVNPFCRILSQKLFLSNGFPKLGLSPRYFRVLFKYS